MRRKQIITLEHARSYNGDFKPVWTCTDNGWVPHARLELDGKAFPAGTRVIVEYGDAKTPTKRNTSQAKQ